MTQNDQYPRLHQNQCCQSAPTQLILIIYSKNSKPQLYQQVTDTLPQTAFGVEPISFCLVSPDIFLANIRQLIYLDLSVHLGIANSRI